MTKTKIDIFPKEKDLSHFLYPSTFFVSKKAYKVTTILGSCVAVCIYDPFTNIGGINHYMLPIWKGEGLPDVKYGDIANKTMVQKLLKLGCDKRNMKAKVFGGAEQMSKDEIYVTVGERNLKVAFKFLKDENIPVVNSHVGGKSGRKIIFDTATGGVLLKSVIAINM